MHPRAHLPRDPDATRVRARNAALYDDQKRTGDRDTPKGALTREPHVYKSFVRESWRLLPPTPLPPCSHVASAHGSCRHHPTVLATRALPIALIRPSIRVQRHSLFICLATPLHHGEGGLDYSTQLPPPDHSLATSSTCLCTDPWLHLPPTRAGCKHEDGTWSSNGLSFQTRGWNLEFQRLVISAALANQLGTNFSELLCAHLLPTSQLLCAHLLPSEWGCQ